MAGGNNISDAFPHPIIRPFTDKPTYFNLLRLREKLVENAATVPSPLGGGQHEHSGLILSDATYHRDTGFNFVRPVFPGVVPAVTAATTVANARIVRDQHESDLWVFTTCTAVENAIRNLIVSVIPAVFLEPMKLPITGLATIVVRDIFGELLTSHGKITSSQLESAYSQAKEKWDATTPFQVLSARIKKAADIVEA